MPADFAARKSFTTGINWHGLGLISPFRQNTASEWEMRRAATGLIQYNSNTAKCGGGETINDLCSLWLPGCCAI